MTIPLFKRFWKRACKVTIGGALTISNLDDNGPRIAFSAERRNSKEPDRCTVRIWNLAEATRKAIRLAYQGQDKLRIRLAVGYEGKTKQIFDGQAEDVEPGRWEGPVDVVTQFIIGDGIDAYREGYVNQSFAPGTPLQGALAAVAAAMGIIVAPASLVLFASKLTTSALGAVSGGLVLNGKAADVMDTLASLAKLRWFIQDDQIVLQEPRVFLDDFAVVLTPTTGLLWHGEPHATNSIKVRALLNPDLQKGRQFILLDPFGKTVGAPAYAIESVRYSGDTEGGPWLANIEEGRAIAI